MLNLPVVYRTRLPSAVDFVIVGWHSAFQSPYGKNRSTICEAWLTCDVFKFMKKLIVTSSYPICNLTPRFTARTCKI